MDESELMKVCFRVDASDYIGTGHVMRCLVLANALRQLGYSISFASLPLKSNLIDFIGGKGFGVVTLTLSDSGDFSDIDLDSYPWLQRSQADDASDFISQVSDLDIVVIDHYGIDHIWEAQVKKELNCKVVAIDDLTRRHAADVVLDQTLGRKVDAYPESKYVLAGSSYALLGSGFANARELALDKAAPKVPIKVLVSMGGIDFHNTTLLVLEALVGRLEAEITLLLSKRSPNYKVVSDWCRNCKQIKHVDFTENMPSVMLDHDIAIGASGTTSWERACLGLPSIVIPIADNQREIGVQLAKKNVVIKVERDEIKSSLLESVRALIEGWANFYKANLHICDGRGANRVVSKIHGLVGSGQQLPVELVLANEGHTRLVYQWQCEPDARKYSLNPEIPTWEKHRKWMTRKLSSSADYMFIVLDASTGNEVGFVRLDRESRSNYLVSILIASRFKGRGFASATLAYVNDIFPDLNLFATVLKANVASQKLFERAGYRGLTTEKFVREASE